MGELKHLSNPRKRKQPRFPSSGERTGNSLNPVGVIARRRCSSGVVGATRRFCGDARELQNRSLAEAGWKARHRR